MLMIRGNQFFFCQQSALHCSYQVHYQAMQLGISVLSLVPMLDTCYKQTNKQKKYFGGS